MHAGKLRAAGTDVVVKVKLSDGLPSYDGSTRYGVTSNSFGSYGASFEFDTTCAATIDKSSSLFIPSCFYDAPILGETSLWLELVYVFSLEAVKPRFELTPTHYGINDTVPDCKSGTIITSGGAIYIKLENAKLPDGTFTSFNLKENGTSGSALYFRVE